MKNKTSAALLAFFLGGLGGHKFYLGQAGQGVLCLILCWTLIPAVCAFVEGIILCTMSDEEFNKNYNNTENNQSSFQKTNKFDELKKLGELKSQGILSDEEFETEKK